MTKMSNTETLPGDARALALFCLLNIERMKPIFDAFEEKYEIQPCLGDFIDQAYLRLLGNSQINLENLKAELEKLIPDSESYSDVLVDQAQCVAIGTYYALEYLENFDPESFKYSLQKLDEVLDIYGFEDGDFKAAELKERKWRGFLSKALSEKTSFDKETIDSLRQENQIHSLPVVRHFKL